jgi:hypothetical protein
MVSVDIKMSTTSRKRDAPIAILTDYGYSDHYAGVMKGVIASCAPDANVIDITHGIAPQAVSAGAIALMQSWRFFPRGTIFVAVVDPGVGTTRAAIAIDTRAGARFVGPDNGLMWPAAASAGIKTIVRLEASRYRLRETSATFHGRDIFAPAAAHLWRGVRIDAMGPRIGKIEKVELPAPKISRGSIRGEVIYLDHFGNLVTNVERAQVSAFAAGFPKRTLTVRIDSKHPMKIFGSYADAPRNSILATFGSFGLLEVAMRDSSAARSLRVSAGARVTVSAGR